MVTNIIYKSSVIAVFLWLGSSAPASAYLDPGTGSIILQAIIGAAAAGLFTLRLYWAKVKAFFTRKPLDKIEPEQK